MSILSAQYTSIHLTVSVDHVLVHPKLATVNGSVGVRLYSEGSHLSNSNEGRGGGVCMLYFTTTRKSL